MSDVLRNQIEEIMAETFDKGTKFFLNRSFNESHEVVATDEDGEDVWACVSHGISDSSKYQREKEIIEAVAAVLALVAPPKEERND